MKDVASGILREFDTLIINALLATYGYAQNMNGIVGAAVQKGMQSTYVIIPAQKSFVVAFA